MSRNQKFKDTSFNLLLGIDITSLLLNLVSCHGFMNKPNSTVILNFLYCLIKNYLSKGFSIIEYNTNQFKLISNDVKLRINLVDKLEKYYVMVKDKAISAVANTIKQLHIQKNIHMTYKQDLYNTKDREIYDFFNALFPS